MVRGPAVILGTALVLAATPASARAEGDIADTIRFCAPIMGQEVTHGGYRRFLREKPDGSLSKLLSDKLVPSKDLDSFVDNSGMGIKLLRSKQGASHRDDRLSSAALLPVIAEAAKETGLPTALIDAIIHTESGYRPTATSRDGSKGLMMLSPAIIKRQRVKDAFNPRENVRAGARHLRALYDQFGSLRLAVAAYDAGADAVRQHGGVPPARDTVRYVDAVLTRSGNRPR